MDKVPLANGQVAEDVIQKGKEGENYTTSAIAENELSAEYELVRAPENATGTYAGTEMSVTYYYNKVEREVILTKYQEDGVTPLEGAKFTIKAKEESNTEEGGTSGAEGSSTTSEETIYTTDSEGKIVTTLEYGQYEVLPPFGRRR